MRAHWQLRDELGGAPWLHETGNLMWYTEATRVAELETRMARLQRWGYNAEWLSRAAVHKLEPNLILEPDVEQVAHFPDESWADGPLLAERMCSLAAARGATMRFASQVVAIEQAGGRVSGVRLADGTRIGADVVVNCAGPAAGRIARLAGRDLPMASVPGLVLRVANVSGLIQRVIHAARVHMRPDAHGLVMLHKGDADEAMIRGDDPREWISTFMAWATGYVSGFAAARLSAWSVGVRPMTVDGRTSAGLLPALPGYAEIVTHSGMTLGPLLGQLVTRQIVDGVTDPLLEPFSPERFSERNSERKGERGRRKAG
jgi:glycine/D-amino acid oxidase-like deaminating enzyme